MSTENEERRRKNKMRKEILVDDCEISYCTNTACHTFLNSFVVNYALVKKMSCSFYFFLR